jgi:hypothetical protein
MFLLNEIQYAEGLEITNTKGVYSCYLTFIFKESLHLCFTKQHYSRQFEVAVFHHSYTHKVDCCNLNHAYSALEMLGVGHFSWFPQH